MARYIPVVLLTRISDDMCLCLLRDASPMTGFRRRNTFLDPHSSVTCGAFHPIPLLSSAAGLRTPEHRNAVFFYIICVGMGIVKMILISISDMICLIRKMIYQKCSAGYQFQYVQKRLNYCIMTAVEQRLSAVRMRLGLAENRESGENPERNRHCMRGGSAQDESRSLGVDPEKAGAEAVDARVRRTAQTDSAARPRLTGQERVCFVRKDGHGSLVWDCRAFLPQWSGHSPSAPLAEGPV